MPNSALDFPKFPTRFAEEDVERLRELEEQKRKMEEVYQAKFKPEAWAKVSPPEKAVRAILPSWLRPVVGVATPWEWGWEYGFTPEQVQEQRFKIEEEYKELARKEKVTRLLPSIETDLMIAALSGEPITDITDLLANFPELRLDFTEEERGYLVSLAQNLIHASPEDILSGKVFAYDPSQLPITPEDIDLLAREAPEIDPRFILSTVAFSKNLEEISSALQQAYPPQVEEVEVDEDIRQKLLDYFKQRSIELGITVPEGEPIKDTIKKVHEKIAEEEGELLTLISEQTGEMVASRRKPDNTVWIGEELIGYWDVEQKMVVPFGFSGQPLTTEASITDELKAVGSSFYRSGIEMAHAAKEYFLTTLLLGMSKPKIYPLGIPIWGVERPEYEMEKDFNERFRTSVIENYKRREEEHRIWVGEHPELKPPPQWEGRVLDIARETPKTLANPLYLAYLFSESAIFTGVFLGASISAGLIAKNPVVGLAAGVAATTPLESQFLFDELVGVGVPHEQAAELAVPIGGVISSVEIVGGLPILRTVLPSMFRGLKRGIIREAVRLTFRQLALKGIKTFGTIEVMEALEEVLQEAIGNATVRWYDETKEVFRDMPEIFVRTLLATLPFGVFGFGSEYVRARKYLPPETQKQLDEETKKFEEAGLSHEHAEAVAASKIIETEAGQAAVELATEKADEEVPTPEAKPAKVKSLESKLEVVNKDIAAFTSSVEIQEQRLTKLTLPHERAELSTTVEGLKEQLSELESKKVALEKQLKKLRKPVVAISKAEAIISLEEISAYEMRISLDLIRKDESKTIAKLMEEIKEKGITEPITIRVREDGSRVVWDGIHRLIVAQDLGIKNVPVKYIGAVKQVEAKPPAVEPTVPEAIEIAPIRRPGMPAEPEIGYVTPDKRPRIQDWDDEQEVVRAALGANPNISGAIQVNRTIKEARERAEGAWRDANEDQRKSIRKEAGLSKNVIAKEWTDMTPPEQQALTLSAIPDRSIHFPLSRELFDMRYYMQFLQEETGLPFYEIFKRAELSHGAARIIQEKFLQRIGTDPNFAHIRTDDTALLRVAQEINSRNPALKIGSPEGLTDQELLLANVIEGVYQEYQNKVRYLRVMRAPNELEALRREFPDAPETELALVKELRDVGNLDDLWLFLQNLEWGIIGSGYDPWMVSYPNLVPTRVRLGTTRGAARLMRRETIEFPEIKMERNVLLRLATYLKQTEAQWRIEPELDALEDLWSKAGAKFSNLGQVESALREWTRELQGIPTRQSFLDSVLRRVWRQAMGAVFLHPWMAFRNFHQALAFHPDRTELPKIATLPAGIKIKAGIYYDTFVSQLKGLRRDWLYMGERGLPGLGWLTRLSDRLSLYSHSDNIPRRWSFEASTNKARRATEQYMKDKDVGRWLRDSGANHLRQTERNYALQLLAQEKFDLAVPGLREVSGAEMASFYIGHEVANMTHFIYERAFRAPVELGATGRTLYNLIVFPRGYFQRLYLQAEKVFGKETTWEQARAGFKDVMLLMIVGIMISEWLRKVTGRPRRAYNPADIIQWQLGGLVIGVGMDLTKLISDLVVALDPTADPEFKRDVLSRLPGELIRSADVLIPFYRNLLDSIEAATDKRNIDVHFLRELRAMFDDSYTPEEVETMDRNLWEKIRKAVLAGEPPDPNQFQQIQVDLQEAQTRLGEMDAEGRFYTLRQLAGEIGTLTKPLPDDMLTEEYNFSELVVFYKECEDKWEELYKLSSSPASIRKEWRESHIEEEAMLLFWGMYSGSVFRRDSPEWEEVSNLLRTWFSYFEVDRRMHPEWADWTLPGA